MNEEEIQQKIESIIANHDIIISELNFLIDTFPEVREKYTQLSQIVEKIQNIDLSNNVDNIVEKLEEYGQLISELNSNLGKNLNLFNLIETKQNSNFNIDAYKIDVYDSNFNLINVPVTIDSENKKLNLTSRFFPNPLYYLKISQNMNNSKLFSNNQFSVYRVEPINNNATKVLLTVDDESIIEGIVTDNKLNDSILYVNNTSKYYIARYGGVIVNGSKKLVLYLFPNVSETIGSVSLHKNLFDDIMMELNFHDFNMQDISEFYFGDAERDLTTGEMIIFDKGNNPKHTFTFSVENNKEIRKRN